MHYVDGEEEKNTCYLNNCDAETWTLAKQAQNKLATAHTKIGQKYAQHHVGPYKDRRTNSRVRVWTNVI